MFAFLRSVFPVCTLLFSCLAFSAWGQSADSLKQRKAIIIPVEEQVDFGLLAYLKRSVAEALELKPDVLVFQVNTYGGELQSAFDIVDLISGIDQCSTYVYVEKKAISAGALISLACNRMVMGEGTTIGDCAPITQSQDGIQMLGEKIQSPLRAKFRNLAERNGYPSLLSQSMVSMDLGVIGAFHSDTTEDPDFYTVKEWEHMPEGQKAAYASHRLILPEGQLLTMTDGEAKSYGFSQGSFASLDAFLEQRGWEKTKVFATTWSEDLVRLIGTMAPLLMLLGFGALYLEFKTPGLSIFGLIGFLCLATVFGSKYAVGLAHYTEFLLLLGGFLLFMAEMWFFPGTFVVATVGLMMMAAALVLSLQGFTVPDPQMPWEMRSLLGNVVLTLSMAAAALVIPFFVAKWVLARLPEDYQIISKTTLAETTSVSVALLSLTVGQRGLTHTQLRPTGKAEFAGHIYDVSAHGEFVEKDVPVIITKLTGNVIVVKPQLAEMQA